MTPTLDRFASQCREILQKDPGPKGREQIKDLLQQYLRDGDLAREYLGPDNHEARKILYEDPDLGFCILAHVYEGAKDSDPHDHGPSWAIYGQAEGITAMREWRKLAEPSGDQPGKVEEVRRYTLEPGQAGVYNEGDLHSPHRTGATRLIRIEGMNMAKVTRDKYVVAA